MPDLEDRLDSLVTGIADEIKSHLIEVLGPLVDELVRERLAAIVEQLGGTPPPYPKTLGCTARDQAEARRA